MMTGYCEAQGKGRAKGRPRKVTQRSFIDGDDGDDGDQEKEDADLIEEDPCLLRNAQRRLQVMIQDCAEPDHDDDRMMRRLHFISYHDHIL